MKNLLFLMFELDEKQTERIKSTVSAFPLWTTKGTLDHVKLRLGID